MCILDVNQLDVTPESDNMQQMPDLVLKTGDARVDGEPAAEHDLSEDEDSWPSESSDEFSDEPVMTSSHPAPSKYSNREDVVCNIDIINNTRAGIEGKIWERSCGGGGKSAQK